MELNNYFIVGIKGVAMCHIAVILKKMGKTVRGADVDEEFITDIVLAKNGIISQVGFDPSSLPSDIETVIYSAAHDGTDNPLVQEARIRGVSVISQADLLGTLISQFTRSIAVCGTHGKTTTSSLLAFALIKLGANPSYMIGSSGFAADGCSYAGGDFNGREYFIIEADEYGVNPPKDKTPKFHSLNPTQILCLNVDYDHPDMYDNLEAVKSAFGTFFKHAQTTTIYCQDDPVLTEVIEQQEPIGAESYGKSTRATYKITDYHTRDGKTVFSLENDIERVTGIELSLYGEKNASNAAGVIAILLNLGYTGDQIKNAVKGFTGPRRRLEQKYQHDETYLFDDYAHHPAEIEATIAALRQRFPDKRIVTVFQPHTFSRTKMLMADFTDALSKSDMALVLPIFASARERADATVSSGDLANGTIVFALDDRSSLREKLKKAVKKGDVIVMMGAGDIYKHAADIIEVIHEL